jgi:hypothetical protein
MCDIFHAVKLIGLPEDYQKASKLIICLGITQDILKKQLKRVLQKTKVMSQ